MVRRFILGWAWRALSISNVPRTLAALPRCLHGVMSRMSDAVEILRFEEDHKVQHAYRSADQSPAISTARHVADGIIDLVAGTAGGIASVYVGQPLDTVKVKMQAFPGLYSNGLACLQNTWRKEGVRRGLYAGTVPALAAQVAENAVLFAAYGYCQKFVASVSGSGKVADLSPVQNACAGSLAAFFATFALCPTELVKCKLQALREMAVIEGRPVPNTGPLMVTRDIIRAEGFRGMFRGLVPTAAREVPGYFFFFGAYETARQLLSPGCKSGQDIGIMKTVAAGGVGGMALWIAVFPADVVKSRVQIQGHGTMVQTMMNVVREDGFKALYKGLGPSLVRTFFATGALFVVLEYTRRALNGVVDPYL